MALENEERDYCCELFESFTDTQNERGLSIGAAKNKELKLFCLQARGVDKSDISQLQKYAETEKYLPVKMLIETQQPIKYCPFCGTSLDKLIIENPSILEETERKSIAS